MHEHEQGYRPYGSDKYPRDSTAQEPTAMPIRMRQEVGVGQTRTDKDADDRVGGEEEDHCPDRPPCQIAQWIPCAER